MKRLFPCAAFLTGLLATPVQAQVMLSIDGGPAIQTESDITSIVYRPSARRLEVSTAWDDLRCVLNMEGPDVPLPVPEPGDFVFALDQLDGDVDGEYVIESDGSIAQLAAAIAGDPTTLSIVTSDARINNCDDDECAVLVCAPGGTPVFSGDFEPNTSDLSAIVAASGSDDRVIAGGTATTISIEVANNGPSPATDVVVDVAVALPADGTMTCSQNVAASAELTLDGNCQGTWSIGSLPVDSSVSIDIDLTAPADEPVPADIVIDAFVEGSSLDLVPMNNEATLDVPVVKQVVLDYSAATFPPTLSTIDLQTPDEPFVFDFAITLDPVSGPKSPSVLNEMVRTALAFPDVGDFTIRNVQQTRSWDPQTQSWETFVGQADISLFGEIEVRSFAPGTVDDGEGFCFGVADAELTSGDAGSIDLQLAPGSLDQRCLDVLGPEPVNLAPGVGASTPSLVIAGAAGGTANLTQVVEITNTGQFDARELAVGVTITIPAAGVTVDTLPADFAPDGNGGYVWNIGTLPIGQTAQAAVVFDVAPDAPEAEFIETTIVEGTFALATGQLLTVDPVTVTASTEIAREADVEVIPFSASPATLAPGDSVSFSVSIQNNGPSLADPVQIDFTFDDGAGGALPAGVSLESATTVFPGTGSFTESVASPGGTWTGFSDAPGGQTPVLILTFSTTVGVTPDASQIRVRATALDNVTGDLNDEGEATATVTAQ